LASPFIPPAKTGGRRRCTDMREVVKALLYIASGGCEWRMLPTEHLRRGIPLDASLDLLDALHLNVRPHSCEDAVAVAANYPATKAFGSSLADRFCMALAITEDLPAITADQAWAKVEVVGLKIQLAR
jgi:transposase